MGKISIRFLSIFYYMCTNLSISYYMCTFLPINYPACTQLWFEMVQEQRDIWEIRRIRFGMPPLFLPWKGKSPHSSNIRFPVPLCFCVPPRQCESCSQIKQGKSRARSLLPAFSYESCPLPLHKIYKSALLVTILSYKSGFFDYQSQPSSSIASSTPLA